MVLIAAVVGIGLIAAGRDTGTGADGKPNFSGNWELNVSKSKFGKSPKPTRMTLQAVRHGEVLHAVQTTYDQAGGPNAVEGDWFLDAKEHPLGSDGAMTSMSKWDGKTLVSERKSKDNSYDEVIHLTLSADGRTATEEIKLKSPNGNNTSTLVWDRR